MSIAPPSAAPSVHPSTPPKARTSSLPPHLREGHLNWPSAGFFAIAIAYTTLVVLIAWGWQTPQLEKAFDILNKGDLDDNAEYSPKEIRILEQAWSRHPGFSRALLGKGSAKFVEPTQPGGWLSRASAHLAVKSEAEQPTRFALEARGDAGDFPIRVKLFGKGLERQVELLSPNEPKPLEWSPNDLKEPGILNIEVNPNRSATAPTWAVRVTATAALPEKHND